jgi:DNA-binding CsgD family transcriptional regulator
MNSNGGWATFVRALGLVPETREQCAVPRQPTALSTAANFFTRVAKIAEGPATTLEKWAKVASEVVWEVSETLRVIDELVEYHGGGEQGADIYVLALAYLEQKPDAELEGRLRRIIRQYGDQIELRRLWKLPNRHKRRVSRTGPSERVEKISSGFRRSYSSYQEALNTLSNYYREDETEVLKDAIRTEVCSEGAWLLLDRDIMNRAGNRIRRDATKAKRDSFASPLLLPDDRVSEKMGRVDLQAFDAVERLQQLMNRAGLSDKERESFLILGRMTSQQAAKELGRSPEQLRQEKLRSVKKLRQAAAH